jgi:urease subunit alpha
MAQSARATRNEGVLDFAITNLIIIDHWGIIKGDIGIKDGKIVGIGKAGNPDTMDGISENMIIGASYRSTFGGAGLIATAGGIDTHIHFICPQQIDHALYSGSNHNDRRRNRSCRRNQCDHSYTPGAWNIQKMLESAEAFPMNLRILRKRELRYHTAPLEEQIEAGALGLKIHEDWGVPLLQPLMPL